jgi:hypothetical protein
MTRFDRFLDWTCDTPVGMTVTFVTLLPITGAILLALLYVFSLPFQG